MCTVTRSRRTSDVKSSWTEKTKYTVSGEHISVTNDLRPSLVYSRQLENNLWSVKQENRETHNFNLGHLLSNVSRDELERVKRQSSAQVNFYKNCQKILDGSTYYSVRGPFYVNTEESIAPFRLQCGSEAGLLITGEEGVIHFRSPCCAAGCTTRFFIDSTSGSEFSMEFLDFNVPSPLMLNSDGSYSCTDSRVFFAFQSIAFCGNIAPKPFKVAPAFVDMRVETRKNMLCRDAISFSLKFRKCDRRDRVVSMCKSQHTVVHEGQSGFITSPGYREGNRYPPYTRCEWDIEVSNNSVIQLSFEFYQISYGIDSVSISTKGHPHTDQHHAVDVSFFQADYRVKDGYFLTLPSYRAKVAFFTDRYSHGKGFKMWYTAASKDSYIPVIDKFVLNCSGHELSLPLHILCDFRDDCDGREDEAKCTYVNETWCPDGHVFGTSCYHLQAPHSTVTWQKAEDICMQQYNGHLVTPNSKEELKFISDLIIVKYPVSTPWYLGFRHSSFGADLLYRKLYQSLDGTTIFNGFIQQFVSDISATCAAWDYMTELNQREVANIPCFEIWTKIEYDVIRSTSSFQQQNVHIACEVRRASEVKPILASSPTVVWASKREMFECVASKERVSMSRRCDWVSDCFDGSDEVDCAGLSGTPLYRRFTCTSGRLLWYSHVCDGVSDCSDGSDEEFCSPVPVDNNDLTVCANGIPVPSSSWCDAKPDCLDASDELDCSRCNGGAILCPSVGCLPPHWAHDDALDCHARDQSGQWILEPDFVPHTVQAQPPPGVVMPDGYGKVTILPLDEGDPCPPTHVQCPKGYCVPIYMLCNGHKDCPEGEDELAETCQSFCKGRFKCHQTSMCLHDDHVCDGWFHCPLHDDERFCFANDTCPLGCACSGEEMTCNSGSMISDLGRVRRLDISYITLQNDLLTIQNHYLISLFAHNSSIRQLGHLGMVNLYHLDLSDNYLRKLSLDTFEKTQGIRQLSLARNELTDVDLQPITSLKNLEILDLSGNVQVRIKSYSFTGLSKLTTLHLDDMGIAVVEHNAFDGLEKLGTLTMKGNSMSVFQKSVLLGLSQLSSLSSDNYKLCCPIMKPESLSKGTCQAPKDEISSCEDILRTSFLRVFLWLMASLTILGNSCVLVYRFCVDRKPSTLGFNTFITNLSASDLLMGMYLAIIGAADQVYRGRYLWEAETWKNSSYCSLAGFLCMVSSEVSAFTICMVTLDRYLALAFPLANVHLTPKRARLVQMVTWVVGVLFAGIPLLPSLSHWRFYSQNGICVPLPITRASFPGSNYAFAIFIMLNFVIFVSIAVGQILIFRSVRANSTKMKGATTANRRNQDTAIAQKLALVVITDFLCWFPIGVMGLLSKTSVPIPGEANVVATIFILPLNSALNPYLYTLSGVRQKLQQKSSNL
ncbi:G-protein coupled receptor GRL101-like, partial [Aplysia californica]|uniref:G-protein coupled receptor GRL101-like n=1 Tax=Aplysia californica TaxID=6500 RepID=A0ABM0ZV05_APLCA